MVHAAYSHWRSSNLRGISKFTASCPRLALYLTLKHRALWSPEYINKHILIHKHVRRIKHNIKRASGNDCYKQRKGSEGRNRAEIDVVLLTAVFLYFRRLSSVINSYRKPSDFEGRTFTRGASVFHN